MPLTHGPVKLTNRILYARIGRGDDYQVLALEVKQSIPVGVELPLGQKPEHTVEGGGMSAINLIQHQTHPLSLLGHQKSLQEWGGFKDGLSILQDNSALNSYRVHETANIHLEDLVALLLQKSVGQRGLSHA